MQHCNIVNIDYGLCLAVNLRVGQQYWNADVTNAKKNIFQNVKMFFSRNKIFKNVWKRQTENASLFSVDALTKCTALGSTFSVFLIH